MNTPEHSHHIEMLVDEVWRSVHRLQEIATPEELNEHSAELIEARNILDQFNSKEANHG